MGGAIVGLTFLVIALLNLVAVYRRNGPMIAFTALCAFFYTMIVSALIIAMAIPAPMTHEIPVLPLQ